MSEFNSYEPKNIDLNVRETEMRQRVREFEERRELEKKAEELQSRVGEEGEEEETEEEKRMRVRKELEKVLFSFLTLTIFLVF